MTKVSEEDARLNDEAIAYVTSLLLEYDETREKAPVAVWLDELEGEFRKAAAERRGMDRRLVRMAVQKILDAASFQVGNSPTLHRPDPSVPALSPDVPIFNFVRRRGRPTSPESIDRVSFAVGAVIARFGVKKYKNDAPSWNSVSAKTKSACDIVAESCKALGVSPASYSGVKSCLTRDSNSVRFLNEGLIRGEYDLLEANGELEREAGAKSQEEKEAEVEAEAGRVVLNPQRGGNG